MPWERRAVTMPWLRWRRHNLSSVFFADRRTTEENSLNDSSKMPDFVDLIVKYGDQNKIFKHVGLSFHFW